MVSMREISPMARPYSHFGRVRRQNTTKIAQLWPKIGSRIIPNCAPDSSVHAPSTTTQSWAERILVPKRSVIGNVLAGGIRKTCGTHQNTTIGGRYFDSVGSFTGDRWTQLTLLVNIMTHTAFTHSDLSVSSAVVNPLFSGRSILARESFATSASAKQKASSFLRTACEKNLRQECRHGPSRSTSTKISSWRRLQA